MSKQTPDGAELRHFLRYLPAIPDVDNYALSPEQIDAIANRVAAEVAAARLDERKRYVEVVNLYGTPTCESLHHPKRYQHTALENCPVVGRIQQLAPKPEKGVEG